MDKSSATLEATTESSSNIANAINFEEGKQYTAGIKGFRYRKEYAFLTVLMNGKNLDLILGPKDEHPISEIIVLKGLTAEFTFKKFKNVNGIDFPQFSLDCMAF